MAKAFTYSRLPEHQVAVYYDGSDKAGAIFKRLTAYSQISAQVQTFQILKALLIITFSFFIF